jgi:ribosomal subunit interface protein
MKTNIKFTGIEPDNELKEYAQKKAEAFGKLLKNKNQDAIFCYIELRKLTKKQKGDVYTAEVTLEAEGKVYRASKDEPNFKKAIDKVKDDILRELRVDKEKNMHLYKKGAKMLKKMLKGEM